MTVGNETYQSVKSVPLSAGLEMMSIWFSTLNEFASVFGKSGDEEGVINHEEEDDEFAAMLRQHKEAMKPRVK